MYVADRWTDFEVLDTGDGSKLERWGDWVLSRPDPQAIWPKAAPGKWEGADAVYLRSERGGGSWEFRRQLPDRWQLTYGSLRFFVRPTGFKHTGLFPEQAVNWDWMRSLLQAGGGARVLNLFAYTGGATVACAAAGAHVTHVDAAKGMTQWAKENRALSRIPESACRFIVEDAAAFVSRERRRGSRYDAVIMDPPSFGRGPSGEVWRIEDELYALADACAALLDSQPLFFLINSYTTGLQASVLLNILEKTVAARRGGRAEAQEVALPVASGGLLPCGCAGRWQA